MGNVTHILQDHIRIFFLGLLEQHYKKDDEQLSFQIGHLAFYMLALIK